MDVTLTAKIRIYPTHEESTILLDTMHAYRDACNFAARYAEFPENRSRHALHDALYYEIRSRFGLRSQMACSVFRTVLGAYHTLRSQHREYTVPEFKAPCLDLVWNRDYTLKENYFSVNTLDGRLKLSYSSKGMEQHFGKPFGSAKLVYKHGKFFLHVSVIHEAPDAVLSESSPVVGIDRGINFLVATYDGDKSSFVSGRSVKQKRAHYKQLRSDLQKIGTPSSRRRLKAIGQRENSWMNDINHCVAKALVQSYPCNTLFVLEDLSGVRHVTEQVLRKYRYVSVSWAFYDLEQKLKYKAALAGQEVINVPAPYTSQRCPKCGHVRKSNRNKHTHVFCCKSCGYTSNDDRAAAINLYNAGKKYLGEKLSRDNEVPGTVICRQAGR